MMDQNYEMALSEVDEILNYADEEVLAKIPAQFRSLIRNNKSKDYTPNIDKNKPISEQKLLKETESIVSLIFRSYLATDEEILELKKQDELEYEELKKKTEIIFPVNKNNAETQNSQISNSLVEIKSLPWYKKIYNKIIKFFNKKMHNNTLCDIITLPQIYKEMEELNL